MIIRAVFFILLLARLCCSYGQDVAPFSPLMIALHLDGQEKKEVYRCYKDKQGRIWFRADDLRIMGFPERNQGAIHYKNRDYFPLDTYEGIEYDLDEHLWLLKIQTPTAWHPNQVVTTEIPLENGKLRPADPGVFLNYDALSGYNGFSKQNYTSALMEAGLFTYYGVGTSTFLANGYDYFLRGQKGSRLDTAWTLDQPERLSTWRFGDSISSGLLWSGAVRFAGIQYATNFATQPSFITMPQPTIRGEANLPSTLDIVVNGMNAQHQAINKGGYEVTQIPLISGKGDIQVVTTDMLGRQQISTFSYYASPLLLKPGLSSYSYELGSIRWGYGWDNFNYGRPMGVATYSLGITSRYTAGLHAELLQEQQTLGFLNNYLVGDWGVATLGFAGSNANGSLRCYDNQTRRGLGGLLNLGFARQAQFLSYGIQSTLATHDYLQLGMFPETAHPNMTVQSYVTLGMGKLGSFSVSYTQLNNNFFDQNHYPNYSSAFLQPDNRVFIINYNRNLFKYFFFNVGALSDQKDNRQVFINLVMPLGADKSLSVNENIVNNQHQETIQLNKNLPLGNGYGYQLTAANNQSSPIMSQFNVQTNQGVFGVNYFGFEGNHNAAFNARGSIIGFGHRVFPARYVDQAFALVDVTGFEHVGVYSRNQIIGKTNRKGYLYIPELLPYQRNELYINNKELPINTQVAQYNQVVIPYRKSGVLVKFAVEVMQNTLLTVYQPNGTTIPAGGVLYLDQNKASYPVGYHGQVFINSAKTEQLSGRVTWDRQSCHFNLKLNPSDKIIKRETVVCS